MGANAQTTVPTFTAGQVLTAAQMNNSARTGVPVFADTTARDAGFGGTGEKVLAEGQLCYLESTKVVQFYNGTAWLTLGPTGVLQVQSAVKTDAFSTTSATYTDITGISIAITPRATSSKILVMAHVQGSQGATNDGMFRLMRDSTVIAESTAGTTNGYGQVSASYGNAMFTMGIAFLDSPSTTSATTYKVQTRIVGGATVFVNRRAADTNYGGSSTITVMEVAG